MDSSQILKILSQELPGPSAFLQLCICSNSKVYEIRIGFAWDSMHETKEQDKTA